VSDKRDAQARCNGEPGRVVPVVDRNRCEAKKACVEVCPFDVFQIRPLEAADRAALSVLGKVKAWVHDDCHACGLCIKACPEQAIRLVPAEP
jgi:4Fe-4S ferredoxin